MPRSIAFSRVSLCTSSLPLTRAGIPSARGARPVQVSTAGSFASNLNNAASHTRCSAGLCRSKNLSNHSKVSRTSIGSALPLTHRASHRAGHFRSARASVRPQAMSAPVRHALISVSDKTDLEDLARGLHGAGYVLVSTGGSKAAIAGFGIPVKGVEELTGFPEMMDGRVKTLHPGVHGGLLARRDDESHMAAAASQNISMIDVLVVNLYPFRATVTKPGVSYADGVENIDIGGPAMIRAAAKNHAHVSVVVDPSDYADFLSEVSQEGGVSLEKRGYLAWKAFQHCSSYDALVSEWLWGQVGNGAMQPEVTVPMRLKEVTRYGENSHQKAAIYSDESLREHGAGGVGSATQHHGKEMSYNNYLDAEAAFSMASDFKDPCCVIVKHTNSCGVSVVKEGERDLLEAYRCAVRADPISAFGGIVAFNTTIDEDMAREIREFRSPTDGETRMFYEIVIAPGYTEKGLEVLKGKSKTLRILEAKPRAPSGIGFRQVSAGWLSQEADSLTPEDIEFTCVSEAQPTPAQLDDLKFAWLCVKHVKSNAITIAKDGRLLGMGSGQPNRVKSVEISIEKAGDEVQGSVLASDAFFPFSWGDSVEKACQAGVTAIVHPGGSMRDQDAIDCCNKYGVVLMTSGGCVTSGIRLRAIAGGSGQWPRRLAVRMALLALRID